MNALKLHLKTLACESKSLRQHEQKMTRRGKFFAQQESYRQRQSVKHEARHHHLAYCFIRGRSYEEVEQNVREGNDPNLLLVSNIVAEYFGAKTNKQCNKIYFAVEDWFLGLVELIESVSGDTEDYVWDPADFTHFDVVEAVQ